MLDRLLQEMREQAGLDAEVEALEALGSLEEAPLIWKQNPGKVELKQVVSYLKGLAGSIDLMKSMPASVANTLERKHKMGNYAAWEHLSDAEKGNIIKHVIKFGEAAEQASSLGRILWNYIERSK